MKLAAPLLLVAGFLLGWLSHGLLKPQPGHAPSGRTFFDISALGSAAQTAALPIETNPTAEAAPHSPQNDIAANDITAKPQPTAQTQPENTPAAKTLQERLSRYLAAENYSAAVGLLQEAEKISRDKVAKLKEILKTHLQSLLSSKRDAAFTELSDRYLAMYYDDTDLLLLLAEFNRNSDYYFDALSMYQLANEYAYSFEQKQQVRGHYRQFMSALHTQLAQQSDWYQLSQIYTQAAVLGLLDAQDQLKQAEVQIALGDTHLARQNLNALISQNQQVSEARALLAKLDGSDKTPEANATEFAKQVALTKVGNQFTVPLTLGRYNAQSTLLIDTGASLTTLSKAAFERHERDLVFSELGSRMFNTANGLAKGRVLQVDYVELGGFQLENALIAVLDFDTHNGIEGLLGMNVLGRFKFQIDQQNSLLLLTPQQAD